MIEMVEPRVWRALAVAVSTIVFIIVALFAVSFAISALVGLPLSLGLPLVVRVVGGVMVVAGIAVGAWIFRYRSPVDMLMSTYITFTKLFRGAPIAEFSGRKELLVVSGPQRYVRHPLYLGVIIMVFGWALVGAYTYVLIGSFAVLLWFWLVLIPFEERELLALFGDQYTKYMESVPMLVPSIKRERGSNSP